MNYEFYSHSDLKFPLHSNNFLCEQLVIHFTEMKCRNESDRYETRRDETQFSMNARCTVGKGAALPDKDRHENVIRDGARRSPVMYRSLRPRGVAGWVLESKMQMRNRASLSVRIYVCTYMRLMQRILCAQLMVWPQIVRWLTGIPPEKGASVCSIGN